MVFTRRDAVATVVVVVVGAIYLAVSNGWDWPLLGSYKSGALALGAVGMIACSAFAGSIDMLVPGRLMMVAMALGAAALILTIVGAVTGSRVVFIVLAADVATLYLVATVRHATGPRDLDPGRLTPAHQAHR